MPQTASEKTPTMKLERREFLKGLLGTVTVAAAGLPLAEAFAEAVSTPVFDPSKEFGGAWLYHGTSSEFRAVRDKLAYMLIEEARRALPQGTPFEIRVAPPINFGRSFPIAWYRTPSMDSPDWWQTPCGWDVSAGIERIARMTA